MNKYNFGVLVILTITLFMSCEESLVYKHQDKPQPIDCPGLDKKLMHEALYSFQDDIARYFNRETPEVLTNDNYMFGYSNFIQTGLSGDAAYLDIVSPHTQKIFEVLRKEKGLWDFNSKKTNLNYEHAYVKCLMDNFKDEDLRIKFASMKEVGYLSPKVLAVPLRGEVKNIVTDPNLAMYLALDGYYQYLWNVDFLEHE